MYYQPSHGNATNLKWIFLPVTLLIFTTSWDASAHKVQTAADVGATLHIEPNDNPRAGEPAKTWFALTRKGGKVIPLAECNCKLAVYAEPHVKGEPALIEPTLQPVAAERYRGIPGANIIFPKPGAYQLQLSGKSVSGSFQPFNFKFNVTVATGTTTSTPTTQTVQNVNEVVEEQTVPWWAIASLGFGVVGVVFVVLQRMKRK
jgi:hypothetical protein